MIFKFWPVVKHGVLCITVIFLVIVYCFLVINNKVLVMWTCFLLQTIQLPDTLIPKEYHIVKNKGVLGLDYFEEWVTLITFQLLSTNSILCLFCGNFIVYIFIAKPGPPRLKLWYTQKKQCNANIRQILYNNYNRRHAFATMWYLSLSHMVWNTGEDQQGFHVLNNNLLFWNFSLT